MKIAAPPDQPATDPTPMALARALRQARAYVTRTAHVPEQPSGSALEQYQPHSQFGLPDTHLLTDPFKHILICDKLLLATVNLIHTTLGRFYSGIRLNHMLHRSALHFKNPT